MTVILCPKYFRLKPDFFSVLKRKKKFSGYKLEKNRPRIFFTMFDTITNRFFFCFLTWYIKSDLKSILAQLHRYRKKKQKNTK